MVAFHWQHWHSSTLADTHAEDLSICLASAGNVQKVSHVLFTSVVIAHHFLLILAPLLQVACFSYDTSPYSAL